MNKWMKIVLLVILIIGLIPQHIYTRIEPDYRGHYSYIAPLYRVAYTPSDKDKGYAPFVRFWIPGCCGEWWQLGNYIPSIRIDYNFLGSGALNIGLAPIPFFINQKDQSRYFMGYVVGLSSKCGWFCTFCGEE